MGERETSFISLVFISMALCIFIVLSIVALLGWNFEVASNKETADKYAEYLRRDIEAQNEFNKSYDELQVKIDELQEENKLLKEADILEWDNFTITAYTSLDEGCNNISYAGIDIMELSKYINIVAVDKDLIDLGTFVIIEKDGNYIDALALDIGGKIKGNKMDLYFREDLSGAYEWGVQENLRVGFLK